MRLRDGWGVLLLGSAAFGWPDQKSATDRHRRLKGSRAAQDGRTDGPPPLFHAGMRLANSHTSSKASADQAPER